MSPSATPQNVEEDGVFQNGAAHGAAVSASIGPESVAADPDLATLIEAWPTLPDAIKADILAMVATARGTA